MKLRLNEMLKPKEWIGLTVGLVAAGAIYFLLIEPSLDLGSRREEAAAAQKKAESELGRLQGQFQNLQQRVVDARKRLSESGGSPPPADKKDFQIARINALAELCKITVDQYVPLGTVEEVDHQAVFLQFTGRGDFASIREYFSRLESQIDFVDVTHFALTSVVKENSPVCLVNWSCRINGVRPDPASTPPAPGPQAARTTGREVVSREP